MFSRVVFVLVEDTGTNTCDWKGFAAGRLIFPANRLHSQRGFLFDRLVLNHLSAPSFEPWLIRSSLNWLSAILYF